MVRREEAEVSSVQVTAAARVHAAVSNPLRLEHHDSLGMTLLGEEGRFGFE